MQDFLFQQLSTVQSNLQPTPATIASAATIAPTTFLTLITGTVQIATITPPVGGTCMLLLQFTDGSPGTMLTTGNISQAIVPTANVPTLMVYNPILGKWYGMAGNLT